MGFLAWGAVFLQEATERVYGREDAPGASVLLAVLAAKPNNVHGLSFLFVSSLFATRINFF